MSRRTLLTAFVTAVLAPLLVAGPARADVPPLQLSVNIDIGQFPVDQPFVGEEFIAQSQSLPVPGDRVGWTCTVSFGDGTPDGGYWRGRPGVPYAPCGAIHIYAAAGTYALTMTVTDPTGDIETVTRSLHVVPRPVTQVDGGVEGTAVTLRAPRSAHWQNPDPRLCTLSAVQAVSVVVRCSDEGTYLVPFATGTSADSGGYAVTFRNGAPRPVLEVDRYAPDGPVASPRVGTGDEVLAFVRTHDPSDDAGAVVGDALTCRFDYGDGRTEVVDATVGLCVGHVTYLTPGTRRIRVSVSDDDGASARRTARVRVLRRDVHLSARGVTTDGTRADIVATLVDGELSGRMRFRAPGGERVVAVVSDIDVFVSGQVAIEGPARLNGERGYLVQASVFDSGATALLATLSSVGSTGPPIANVEGDRSAFDVSISAPVVS